MSANFGLAEGTRATAPSLENFGGKELGLDLMIVRNKQLASAIESPGDYINRRTLAMESIRTSVQALWKGHYNGAIALGYSEEQAKDHATKRVAPYSASELAFLDSTFPQDPLQLAVSQVYKASTVGVPKIRRSRKSSD